MLTLICLFILARTAMSGLTVNLTYSFSCYTESKRYENVTTCTASGSPIPSITWLWTWTKEIGSVHGTFSDLGNRINEEREYITKNSDTMIQSSLSITANKAVTYKCRANNSIGEAEDLYTLAVTELDSHRNGVAIEKINSTVAVNSEVTLKCLINKYISRFRFWTFKGTNATSVQTIKNKAGVFISNYTTSHSVVVVIKFSSIQLQHQGLYICNAYIPFENFPNINVTQEIIVLDDFRENHNNYGTNTTIFTEDSKLLTHSPIYATVAACSLIIIFIALIILKRKCYQGTPGIVYKVKYCKRRPSTCTPIKEETKDGLPFDRCWTFPLEKLHIGNKVLGSGAFGIVKKAEAEGILKTEPRTTVAVKSLKNNATYDEREALNQELDILTRVGRHVNVLTLLGVCIQPAGLLIIMQYCENGNLREFLRTHRKHFVNQVNPATGRIKASVPNTSDQDHYLIPRSLTTCDLIGYAYQTSQGMEYLASRRFVHRDLATRNILIAENNVIKISDFGLTKECVDKEYYRRKRRNGKMPLKWMAIESIGERKFSTESDVWSFGVVLWELFSLGANPYPGLAVDSRFYQKLVNGYRLSKPQFAPQIFYNMMIECWNCHPWKRPTFSQLRCRIEDMLHEKKYYNQLNSNYLQDYLPMASSENDDYVLPDNVIQAETDSD